MYKFCRLIKLLIVGGMVFVKVVFFLMLSFISFVMVQILVGIVFVNRLLFKFKCIIDDNVEIKGDIGLENKLLLKLICWSFDMFLFNVGSVFVNLFEFKEMYFKFIN